MQGTRVRALAQEDPTWCRATKPVHRNYRARMLQLLKPMCHIEARVPRAPAPQQEKPPEWEAHAPQQRPNTAKINL